MCPPVSRVEEADELRESDPDEYARRSMASMVAHIEAMLAFQERGAEVFDYGNNLRQRAYEGGVENAFDFPGFVPAYIRPLFCEGKGPFRWVALSGDPEDIYRTDEAIMEMFPEDEHLHRWLKMAKEQVPFQGLPSRICWLGYGERVQAGLMFNNMVGEGICQSPDRDRARPPGFRLGGFPQPGDRGDAGRHRRGQRWPILNALINAVGGATWVSFHHGGGVGIGYSQHAGQVIVADGTPEAAARLERVLTTDPGMGVVRHADAGYEQAIDAAKRHGIKMPMLK